MCDQHQLGCEAMCPLEGVNKENTGPENDGILLCHKEMDLVTCIPMDRTGRHVDKRNGSDTKINVLSSNSSMDAYRFHAVCKQF